MLELLEGLDLATSSQGIYYCIKLKQPTGDLQVLLWDNQGHYEYENFHLAEDAKEVLKRVHVKIERFICSV